MFHSNDLAASIFVIEAALATDEGLNRHYLLIEFLPKSVIGVSHQCLVNQAQLKFLELIVDVEVRGPFDLTLYTLNYHLMEHFTILGATLRPFKAIDIVFVAMINSYLWIILRLTLFSHYFLDSIISSAICVIFQSH